MRKRLVFETLHLDLEGGVSERRTTPAVTSIENIIPPRHEQHDSHAHAHDKPVSGAAGMATVEVQLEQVQQKTTSEERPVEIPVESSMTTSVKKVKQKKRVAFTSDRPDLYDF